MGAGFNGLGGDTPLLRRFRCLLCSGGPTTRPACSRALNLTAIRADRLHECRCETVQRVASGDQDIGYHVDLSLGNGIGHSNYRGRARSEAFDLRLLAFRAGEPKGFNRGSVAEADSSTARAFSVAGELEERRLA